MKSYLNKLVIGFSVLLVLFSAFAPAFAVPKSEKLIPLLSFEQRPTGLPAGNAYDELRTLPTNCQRKQALDRMAPYEKSQVWREQFTQTLVNRNDLDWNQRQILRYLIDNVGDFLTRKNSAREIQRVVEANFNQDDIRDIFASIVSGGTRLPVQEAKDCNCNVGSVFGMCPMAAYCNTSYCAGNGCVPTSDGCGFLGMYECDGKCMYHECGQGSE